MQTLFWAKSGANLEEPDASGGVYVGNFHEIDSERAAGLSNAENRQKALVKVAAARLLKREVVKGFRRGNPKGKDGKPLRCHTCGSGQHLKRECPNNKTPARPKVQARVGIGVADSSCLAQDPERHLRPS